MRKQFNMEIPSQIKHAKALRKPEKLPDNAENAYLRPETIEFLDTLRVFEVDGEHLWQEEFPTKDRFYILWDFTTNLAWLADSSGFNYPRYVININPWRSEKLLSQSEHMPESRNLVNKLLENTDYRISPESLKTLIAEVSSWQKSNPYPDYGILWVKQSTGSVAYTVGDGQEGDFDQLEDTILAIPGVKHFQLLDEATPGDKEFKMIWRQGTGVTEMAVRKKKKQIEKKLIDSITEMTSSMSMGTAPMAAVKKKQKQKVDTPYKGSWADTVNKTPIPKKREWPSSAFPDKVNPNNWVKLNQSTELIGNLLAETDEGHVADLSKIDTDTLRSLVSVQRHAGLKNPRAMANAKRGAEELYHREGQVIPMYMADGTEEVFNGSEWVNESENLEKNKFEVVCLDSSGKEVSTKSFSTEEAAQEHIEKKNEKLDGDEVGCSYKIRVVAKEKKDPFAMTESKIRIGKRVAGIMGVDGNKSGVVMRIGSPYSSGTKSPTVWVKSDDGSVWDTFAFNLRLLESKSGMTECSHGDIVRLTGYLERPGYFKVDTQDAIGASQERPWVEDLSDPGSGFYIDPSDTDDMELVLSSEEHDTRMINTFDDVENVLNFGDVEFDD